MAQVSTAPAPEKGFGATDRRDPWWLGPLLTLLGLTAFVVYGLWAAWQDGYFEIRQSSLTGGDFYALDNQAVAPYLAPFYAPLIYDKSPPSSLSHHAWFNTDLKANLGLPAWFPLSPAFLILAFPGLFRFTCYYYRKAYYRAFVLDPPGCAVGEPWKADKGENRLPMILQNSHRYWMYIACIFLVILTWDALISFWWPTLDASGAPTGGHQFGMGVGTLVLLANVVFLTAFTFGCNSVRHLVGGRLDCFSCPNNIAKMKTGYKLWRFSTLFNEHHMEWAWISLFSVGFADLYVRLCSLRIIHDVRLF
jgi:hypothetical protein